jgi:YVTN family beta-propeller protein
VSVISTSTNTVLTTVAVPDSPACLVYDAGKGEVVVGVDVSYSAGNIVVISDTANRVVANITLPLSSAAGGLAYDPEAGDIFATDSGSDEVSVINDSTNLVTNSSPVYSDPTSVAFDSGTNQIFVANSGSTTISVLNVTNLTHVTTVGVYGNPSSIAYDSERGELYVVDGDTDVSVINDTSDNVTRVIGPTYQVDLQSVAYDSGHRELFVTNSAPTNPNDYPTNNVEVINDSTNRLITNISAGNQPYGLAYDGQLGEMIIADFRSNDISIVNDTSDAVIATVLVGAAPNEAVFDSATGQLFVSDTDADSVYVINYSTDTRVDTIAVGGGPIDLAYAPEVGEIFVSDTLSNNLSVINDTTDRTVTNISLGTQPAGLAYDSRNGELFVANDNLDYLSVINTSSYAYLANITVRVNPYDVVYDSGTNQIFVGYEYSDAGNLSIISASQDVVVANLSVQSFARTMAYDPALGEVFVGDVNSNNVSVVSDSTDQVVAVISGISGPWNLVYDPTLEEVYVSSIASDNVTVLDALTDSVIENLTAGQSAIDAAYDSLNGLVYETDMSQATIAILGVATSLVYPVRLTESGLPPGILWSVNLDGRPMTASTNSIMFYEPNGTYPFTVESVPGYFVAPSSGNLTVDGAAVGQLFVFSLPTPTTFSITFTETGLSDGTDWSITLNGSRNASMTNRVGFVEPTGTYSFEVGAIAGWTITPPTGNVTVNRTNVTLALQFTPIPPETYSVEFTESGLTPGTTWAVDFDNVTQQGNASLIDFGGTANGSYDYSIGPVTGYRGIPPSGVVTVNGTEVAVPISFAGVPAATYAVTFQESGLPAGTNWTVTLAARTVFSTNLTISFLQPNGSFVYEIGPIAGFTFKTPAQSVFVSGKPVEVTITFTPNSNPPSGFPIIDHAVLALAVAAAAVALAVLLTRRRRKLPPESAASPSAPEGAEPHAPS